MIIKILCEMNFHNSVFYIFEKKLRMSSGKLRENKICLNCKHFVEKRFCPNCGQQNTETRHPFHYLFTHFIEDFTHYDGQFWKTIKYLLFRPGKLTKEYLAGKRQQYVQPVKLYIFISFITFLLIAFSRVNIGSQKENTVSQKEKAERTKEIAKNLKMEEIVKLANRNGNLSTKDSLKLLKNLNLVKDSAIAEHIDDSGSSYFNEQIRKGRTYNNLNNIEEFDVKYKNAGFLHNVIERPIAKKFFELRDKGVSKKEIVNGFMMSFFHTLPKALFLYLPFYAFLLWVFHNKKKWWYFDHGIFTLHYFSFLLLVTFLLMGSSKIITHFLDYRFINTLFGFVCFAAFFYTILYFFLAHKRVYGTQRATSIALGILIFFLNSIGFLLMLVILVYLSFVMIH